MQHPVLLEHLDVVVEDVDDLRVLLDDEGVGRGEQVLPARDQLALLVDLGEGDRPLEVLEERKVCSRGKYTTCTQ